MWNTVWSAFLEKQRAHPQQNKELTGYQIKLNTYSSGLLNIFFFTFTLRFQVQEFSEYFFKVFWRFDTFSQKMEFTLINFSFNIHLVIPD